MGGDFLPTDGFQRLHLRSRRLSFVISFGYRPPSALSSLLFLPRPPALPLASNTRPAHGRISRATLGNELGLGGCCAALHALRILAGSRRGPGLAPPTYWCCGAGRYNDPDCNT